MGPLNSWMSIFTLYGDSLFSLDTKRVFLIDYLRENGFTNCLHLIILSFGKVLFHPFLFARPKQILFPKQNKAAEHKNPDSTAFARQTFNLLSSQPTAPSRSFTFSAVIGQTGFGATGGVRRGCVQRSTES